MLDDDRKPFANDRAMAELDPQRPLKRQGSGHDDMLDKKPRLEAIANAQRDAKRAADQVAAEQEARLQNAQLVRQRNIDMDKRLAAERVVAIADARRRAEDLYAGRPQVPVVHGGAPPVMGGMAGFGGAGRNPYNSEDEDDNPLDYPIMPAGFDANGLPIARGNEEWVINIRIAKSRSNSLCSQIEQFPQSRR